jgi:transposase
LNKWAGCSRFLYNKTIGLLTSPTNTEKNINYIKKRFTSVKYRDSKKLNTFFFNKPWLETCPATVRKESIFEAESNLKSCYSNLKSKNIKHFEAPFKTKHKEKTKGWTISIEKQYIHKDDNQLSILDLETLKYHGIKQLQKLIPNNRPDNDCKIQKDAYGDYYLIIPYERKIKNPPIISKNPVSIDPGVRKFLTTFAPNSKESFIMGNRSNTELMSILIALDKLYASYAKIKDKKVKEKINRLRKRLCNLKIEIRNQCANFLSKRYDLILMPKLDVKQLILKANRRLKTKTVRQMLSAGHSGFFKFLKEKCEENGCQFLHVREEYTSQTCPCCGCLNKCNEIYKCRKCDYFQDRDLTGALNIMLKAITNPKFTPA